jgi:ATP-dependent Lon protease
VMRESMQAAHSWVRSNAPRLGIDEDFFSNFDIHVHVPAGAIPKDGPSAGVTIVTALVSLLSGQRVRPLTAMTGEITLSGNVLPVGGIKEKVLAAKRAGVRDVILPAENKMNVEEDLTPEQLENLTVHYVKTIEEALQFSLPAVAAGTAAKIIPPTPPKDPKQDYNPTQPVREPEGVHDRVLTQA